LRVPPFERYSRMMAGFGLFLSGMIVGSAVYMSIYQHNFSLLYVKLHKYQEENAKLLQDKEDWNKNKNKQTVINTVNVYVDNAPSEQRLTEDIQAEIEKDVKLDLKLVIGQKINNFKEARQLYEQLISQKTYVVHEKKYQVQVKSILLIQTELSLWITAKETRT
jgi:hypothetical protein